MNESTQQTQAASYATTAAEAWDWNASQLAELNRHLDKPFGEVERFNQALAFTLWMDGHVIGRMTGGEWHACNPVWYRDARYCVLPKPEPLLLPSIDWSAVAAEFNWLTQDEDGRAWLWATEPQHGFGEYQSREWVRKPPFDTGATDATMFASLTPGKGDWKKLIVQRPEVTK